MRTSRAKSDATSTSVQRLIANSPVGIPAMNRAMRELVFSSRTSGARKLVSK